VDSTNTTLPSTSVSNTTSTSTARQKFVPSATPNPKVKKRGSSGSQATSESSKVKKNVPHPGNIQNVNTSREALSQEGSDQQVCDTKL
jgi:hypothetical protein